MSDIYQIIVNNSYFGAIGTADFELLDDESLRLGDWLAEGMHGTMRYMERSKDIRHDLRALFPDVQSVIVTLTPYAKVEPHVPVIAAFAHNFEDYHREIKNRLHTLLHDIQAADPSIRGRVVVDSAPTFERAWAVRAGLGWIGRNSMLINPELGSYTLIGLLLINKKIGVKSERQPNRCPRECTLCRKTCPNGAIKSNHTIDARRCISYLTIENKETSDYPTHGHIFGCDRCIEVCPFNKHIETIAPVVTSASRH